MTGISLTNPERSRLLEQLLKQQQQRPQIRSGGELAARLLAQGLRQKKIKGLREQEAAAENTRGKNQDAVVAALVGDPTKSVFGTELPQNTSIEQAIGQLPTNDPLRQAVQEQIVGKAFAAPQKAPTTRSVKRGNETVTEEFINGRWMEVGRSPIDRESRPKPTKANFIDADTGQAHAGSFDGELYRTSAGSVIRNASPIAPAAGQKDLQNNRQAFRPIEAATADSLGEIDNLIGQISAAPNPETLISVLGTATRGISAIANQARSAAAIFSSVKAGQSLKAVVNGKTVNETALFDVNLYDFGNAAIGSAAVQSNILNLAYSIARTQDPGGRLSDRDVQTFITVITGGDVAQTIAKLQETRRRTVSTFKNDAISRDLQDRLGSFEQRFGISLDTASGISLENDTRLKNLGL